MGLFSSIKQNIQETSESIFAQYLGGHPEINRSGRSCIRIIDKSIVICDGTPGMGKKRWGAIDGDSVTNIIIEDKSTIEHRVTMGRLLTVGVFAFAWKKKKKNNDAFLIIEWKIGDRFSNETIFEFEGKNAMQMANIARNKIIKGIE